MNNQVGNLIVRLGAEQATFDRDVKKAQTALRNFTGQAKTAQNTTATLSGTFARAANSASILYGPLNGVSGRLSSMATMLSTVNLGWVGVGASASAAIAGLKYGTATFAENEARLLKQEQLLRATGYASGYTANQLDVMARSIAKNTLANTQGVAQAQSVLLTFKSVVGDTFGSAMVLSQDLASVMGTDIKSAALQLGKALESPTEGMTALKRSGVSFSASQKEMIKEMEETGRIADAQRLILKTLENQLGGAGAAEAQGMTGVIDTLGQEWEEFWEHMADRTGAAEATKSALTGVTQALAAMNKQLFPQGEEEFTRLSNERYALKQKMDKGLNGRNPDTLPNKSLFVSNLSGGYDKETYKADRERLDGLTARMQELQNERKKQIEEEGEAKRKADEAEKTRLSELKAEQQRQRKLEAEKLAKRKAANLEAQQQSGATRLTGLDRTYGDDSDALRIDHESRLAEIESMVLSEVEIRRRGFESIEALRQVYAEREKEHYAQEKSELEASRLESLESELDFETTKNQSKEELAVAEWEKKKALIDAEWQYRDNLDQEMIELSAKNWQEYQDTLKAIEQEKNQTMIQSGSQLFGELTDITATFGDDQSALYASMFIASKAFSVAESIMAIQTGIAQAAANPFPANIAAMASVASATSNIISTIQGTNLSGMAHDGIDEIPTEGTWLLDKGERVVDSRTNSDLKNYLADGSRGSNVTVNLIEDASRAGTVEESGDGDATTLDIRVAKLLQSSSSQTAAVMQTRYRSQQYGS